MLSASFNPVTVMRSAYGFGLSGVPVAVPVGLAVAPWDSEAVRDAVGVAVAVHEGVYDREDVGVDVCVAVTVGVDVGDGVEVRVGDGRYVGTTYVCR